MRHVLRVKSHCWLLLSSSAYKKQSCTVTENYLYFILIEQQNKKNHKSSLYQKEHSVCFSCHRLDGNTKWQLPLAKSDFFPFTGVYRCSSQVKACTRSAATFPTRHFHSAGWGFRWWFSVALASVSFQTWSLQGSSPWDPLWFSKILPSDTSASHPLSSPPLHSQFMWWWHSPWWEGMYITEIYNASQKANRNWQSNQPLCFISQEKSYLQFASLALGSLWNNAVLYNQRGGRENIWAPSRPCSPSKLECVVFGCPKWLSLWRRMELRVLDGGGLLQYEASCRGPFKGSPCSRSNYTNNFVLLLQINIVRSAGHGTMGN